MDRQTAKRKSPCVLQDCPKKIFQNFPDEQGIFSVFEATSHHLRVSQSVCPLNSESSRLSQTFQIEKPLFFFQRQISHLKK